MQFLTNMALRADEDKSKFGIVLYNDQPETVYNLTSFSRRKLRKVKPKKSGKANLPNALKFIRETLFLPENGDIQDNPNAIVLIRDETSKQADEQRLEFELDELIASNIVLYQLVVGTDLENDTESNLIRRRFGDDSVDHVNSFRDVLKSKSVNSNLSRIIRSFCKLIDPDFFI